MIRTEKDIEITDDGDLILKNGDLKMATVAQSTAQAINFVVMTDYAEYTPAPLAAGNLGAYIGGIHNSSTRSRMISSLRLGFNTQQLLTPGELSLNIVPLSADDALVTVKLVSIYVEDDEADLLTEPLIFGYLFPYSSGIIEKVVLPG